MEDSLTIEKRVLTAGVLPKSKSSTTEDHELNGDDYDDMPELVDDDSLNAKDAGLKNCFSSELATEKEIQGTSNLQKLLSDPHNATFDADEFIAMVEFLLPSSVQPLYGELTDPLLTALFANDGKLLKACFAKDILDEMIRNPNFFSLDTKHCKSTFSMKQPFSLLALLKIFFSFRYFPESLSTPTGFFKLLLLLPLCFAHPSFDKGEFFAFLVKAGQFCDDEMQTFYHALVSHLDKFFLENARDSQPKDE